MLNFLQNYSLCPYLEHPELQSDYSARLKQKQKEKKLQKIQNIYQYTKIKNEKKRKKWKRRKRERHRVMLGTSMEMTLALFKLACVFLSCPVETYNTPQRPPLHALETRTTAPLVRLTFTSTCKDLESPFLVSCKCNQPGDRGQYFMRMCVPKAIVSGASVCLLKEKCPLRKGIPYFTFLFVCTKLGKLENTNPGEGHFFYRVHVF